MARAFLLNLVFFLLVTFASADFSAVSQYSELNVCQDYFFDDTITITNQDAVPRQYLIQGETAQTLVIDAGQSINIKNRISGKFPQGTYNIKTLIADETGGARILEQNVNIIDCTTTITAEQNSFSNCACTPTLYRFDVFNNAKQTLRYDLSVNLSRELYTLSAESIEVESGQSFPVYVYVIFPCDDLGRKELMFKAESVISESSAPFYLQVRDCYSYIVQAGELGYGDFVAREPAYSFCTSEEPVMPVRIENTGELANNFTLSLDEANLSANFVYAEAASQQTVYVTTNAPEGIYYFNLTIQPGFGQASELSFSVEIVNCTAQPENTGKRLLTWVVVLFIVAIIIAVAIILFPTTWFRPGTAKPVWPWKWIITGLLAAAFLAFLVIFWKSITSWLVQAWVAVYSFIFSYWLYFVIGLVLMLFIILYYWGLGRKIRMIWFWVIIALLTLFLVFALSFFTGLLEVQPQTNQTTVPIQSDTTYTWKKNTVEKIDMSRFLDDPDEDDIQLIATPVENISVEIDGLKVKLIPQEGFSGERTINFIADDRRGGRAVSPDITLVVLDEEASLLDPFFDFLSKYANYIVIVIFAVLISVILLVLRVTRPKKAKKVIVRRKKRK